MSTTSLKIVAVLCMVLDHTQFFFSSFPIQFRYIGRLAAPIFIFCSLIGFDNTRNRKKYLCRIYLFSCIIAVINLLTNKFFINISDSHYLLGNFATPIFLILLLIYLIDNNIKLLSLFFIYQLITFITCMYFAEFLSFPSFYSSQPTYYFWGSIFGNIMFVEGGPLIIFFGVSLYFVKDSKYLLPFVYILFTGIIHVGIVKLIHYRGLLEYIIPFPEYQWMMVFAIPFLLLYNGKKGIGFKYFFYIFYPLHIVFIYIISLYMIK